MKIEDVIKKNPNLKLLSKAKLSKALEKYEFSKAEIDDYHKPKELHQIYSKPTKTKPLKITAPPYSFQIDIALLPTYKGSNAGKDKFFIAVDILSRKAFAYVLKSGKMKDVLDVYENFLVDVDEQVHSVAGDDFFNNAEFKEFNEHMLIDVWTDVAKDDHITRTGDKLGIVDRCIRTLKMYIQKYMIAHKTTKWTTVLKQITELYNDTANAGLNDMTPDEVFSDYDYMLGLYKGQKAMNKEASKSFDFPVGHG